MSDPVNPRPELGGQPISHHGWVEVRIIGNQSINHYQLSK